VERVVFNAFAKPRTTSPPDLSADEDQNAGNQSDEGPDMGGGEVHFGLQGSGGNNGQRAWLVPL